MNETAITHGSLFSGIGGFDLAAQMVGFKNQWNCEIKEYCRKVLAKNFPTVKQYTDITKMFNPESVDIISGGFPCQDISYAKSWTTNNAFRENGIDGKRSGLWFEYLRIIKETKPKFVVAENVAALTKQGLDKVLYSLSDIGYDAEWAVITAAQFGAPHLRKRIWIVAYPCSSGRKQESIILGKVISEKIRHSSQWELSRTVCKTYGKKALPQTYGIHDGIPRGLDDAERIEAMGNAIVPQIAVSIFEVIKETIYSIQSQKNKTV